MQPIDLLFDSMIEVEPYPTGVVRVPGRIPGTAFFPGGYGLWQRDGAVPQNPIMILGHDFHSEAGFRESLDRGGEVVIDNGQRVMGPTWRSLTCLLKAVDVDPSICFFTNAYMGLREGADPTGRFPGSNNPGFVERCRAFLRLQIRTMRPRAILTLGAWVPAFIAPLSPELECWTKTRSFFDIDNARPMIPNARFPGAPDVVCTVGALTHPSLRGPNVRHRRYAEARGHPAELQLIRNVLFHAAASGTH
jgi:hypothetical protein